MTLAPAAKPREWARAGQPRRRRSRDTSRPAAASASARRRLTFARHARTSTSVTGPELLGGPKKKPAPIPDRGFSSREPHHRPRLVSFRNNQSSNTLLIIAYASDSAGSAWAAGFRWDEYCPRPTSRGDGRVVPARLLRHAAVFFVRARLGSPFLHRPSRGGDGRERRCGGRPGEGQEKPAWRRE